MVGGSSDATAAARNGLGSAELYEEATGTWRTTGPLATPRQRHIATLLPSGKVLVVGGTHREKSLIIRNRFISMERSFLATPSSSTRARERGLRPLRSSRRGSSIPPLAFIGEIVIAGGVTDTNGATETLASAESYDEAAGTWTSARPLGTPRCLLTATLLASGKLLVVGGTSQAAGDLASAELYDPKTGTWAPTGSLATPRYSHTATLLSSGKVLVVGGIDWKRGQKARLSAELYDETTGTWTRTGSLAAPRLFHTATLLRSGKVLVAGGSIDDPLSTAELYDEATGTWTTTGSLAIARELPTATLLPSGKVLVVGGADGTPRALASAELYDEASGTWTTTGSMATARFDHTATLLPSSEMLSFAIE